MQVSACSSPQGSWWGDFPILSISAALPTGDDAAATTALSVLQGAGDFDISHLHMAVTMAIQLRAWLVAHSALQILKRLVQDLSLTIPPRGAWLFADALRLSVWLVQTALQRYSVLHTAADGATADIDATLGSSLTALIEELQWVGSHLLKNAVLPYKDSHGYAGGGHPRGCSAEEVGAAPYKVLSCLQQQC